MQGSFAADALRNAAANAGYPADLAFVNGGEYSPNKSPNEHGISAEE